MTKKLLSDFQHDDPFIHDISRGMNEKELEEEDVVFFTPDIDQGEVTSRGGPASSTVRFTPTPEHQHSYVPSFGKTAPLFYAQNADDDIPYFEPDCEPLFDYNGIQHYAQYHVPQNAQFHLQMGLLQDDGEEEEVVVELRPEQVVRQQSCGDGYFTPHPSTGNYVFDSLIYKHINPPLTGNFAQPQDGQAAESISSKLKYDLSSYFYQHIFPTLNNFFDVTINKNIKKIFKRGDEWSYREKQATSEEDLSQLYCRDVSRQYSVIKASFWMVAILILLWGIPEYGYIIAPLVAGYVGGRKAGNEFKAFLAALLPTVISTLLILLFTTNTIPFNSYHHALVTLHDTFFDIIAHLSVYESSNKDPSSALSSVTTTGTATFFSMLALALIGGTMERDMRNLKRDLEIYRKEDTREKRTKEEKRDEAKNTEGDETAPQ